MESLVGLRRLDSNNATDLNFSIVMKKTTSLFAALFTMAFVALLIQTFFDSGLIASVAVSGVIFLVHQVSAPKASLTAGLYPELWTGELVDKFRHKKSWLSLIPRRDDLVKNNTIHLVDVGVDPNVLINNTTYPIPSSQRTDADIALTLDKFDSENTRITDDELYNLPYDKEGSVMQDHRIALEDKTAVKSAHSLAPASGNTNGSTPTTPIIPTTGAADGRAQARKRIVEDDLVAAKEAMDDLDIPEENRLLVLCTQHFNDLLKTSQVFKEQIKNIQTGQLLAQLYGFTIMQYSRVPVYTKAGTVYTKRAFGAVAAPATDLKASFFLYTPRAIQALGTAKMYYSIAAENPGTRESTVGFRLYHMCLQKKAVGFGAIVSEPAA